MWHSSRLFVPSLNSTRFGCLHLCRPPRHASLLQLAFSSDAFGDVLLSEMVRSFLGLDGHGHPVPVFIPELPELDCERVLVKSLRLISLSQRMRVPSTSSPGCIRGHRLCIHVNLFLDDKNSVLIRPGSMIEISTWFCTLVSSFSNQLHSVFQPDQRNITKIIILLNISTVLLLKPYRAATRIMSMFKISSTINVYLSEYNLIFSLKCWFSQQ